MLSKYHVHPTVPAKDIARAKKFYSEVLQLPIKMETPAGLMFECGDNSWMLVYPGAAGEASHTLAGWIVDDIHGVVADLKSRGVKFEEYDYPNLKTEDGIAKTPVGHSAWFKDTEGNTLGMVQFDDPDLMK